MPGPQSSLRRLRKLVCAPGIHVFSAAIKKDVDGRAFASPKRLRPRRRDKPGHDEDRCENEMSSLQNSQRLPARLTPLDVALAALLRDVKPVAARGRMGGASRVAIEVPELTSWPLHDIAVVDGWALRASDLVGASSYTPLPLAKPPVWLEAGDQNSGRLRLHSRQ